MLRQAPTIWCIALGLLVISMGSLTEAAKPADAKKKAKQEAKRAEAKKEAAANNGAATAPVGEPVNTTRDPLPVAAALDKEIDLALANAKEIIGSAASDAEFLRRVTIDITGHLPTREKVASYIADKNPEKQKRLIDELLASPAYGEHFGGIWYDLLIVPSDDNRRAISHSFERWLTTQFNANIGWNKTVSEILTASGEADENPATVFWFAHSVTGVNPPEVKVKPAEALGQASQRFLGTQIQCAECHNHPFTGFPQADFWSAAAFFGRMNLKNADKKTLRNGEGEPKLVDQAVGDASIAIPEKNISVSAKLPDGAPYRTGEPLRAEFARWCTAPENENFAREAANRMWAHFFGRGFVNPIDDLRPDNPPSHPEALKRLAEEFRESGFDLKHLVRCICNTRAYQRTSDVPKGEVVDERLFGRMQLKAMSARVLRTALSQAAGRDVAPAGAREDGGKKGSNAPKDQFLKQFATTDEVDLPDYSHGIPQVLRLMNAGVLDAECPTIRDALSAERDSAKVIERLYVTALGRAARPEEIQRMQAYVARSQGSAAGYADVYWVLLNSSEFVLNH